MVSEIKRNRKPAWQNWLVKLRDRKEKYGQWKQRCVAWEYNRDALQICGDGIKRASAQMELYLVRDVKNNRKGFYKYIGQKERQWRVHLLW